MFKIFRNHFVFVVLVASHSTAPTLFVTELEINNRLFTLRRRFVDVSKVSSALQFGVYFFSFVHGEHCFFFLDRCHFLLFHAVCFLRWFLCFDWSQHSAIFTHSCCHFLPLPCCLRLKSVRCVCVCVSYLLLPLRIFNTLCQSFPLTEDETEMK